MPDGILDVLAANPPASLGEVVRLAVDDPSFAISGWRVERLSDQGIRNPDGLLLFSGRGGAGRSARDWSVVVKIIANEDADGLPEDHLWYWKREVLAFEPGLLGDLPAGMCAPRCYRAEAHERDMWIWMEHEADEAPRNSRSEEFARAAHAAGRFGGAYLSGRPLPDRRWLVRDHARGWVGDDAPEAAWANDFVKRSFPSPLRRRVVRLWEEREQVFDWLRWLPQTFVHGDYHRRNLMIRRVPDGIEQVVALDWAWCGIGAVGGDLGMLLGMSAILGHIDPATLPLLDRAVGDAYLAGLRDAGWSGDGDLARLGYAAWLAIYAGVTAPGLAAFWTGDDRLSACERLFGPPQDAAERWAAICEFALDRGDEARALTQRLRP